MRGEVNRIFLLYFLAQVYIHLSLHSILFHMGSIVSRCLIRYFILKSILTYYSNLLPLLFFLCILPPLFVLSIYMASLTNFQQKISSSLPPTSDSSPGCNPTFLVVPHGGAQEERTQGFLFLLKLWMLQPHSHFVFCIL